MHGKPLLPRKIHFVHPYAHGSREHEIIFGCPVKFQQNRNQIVLDRDALALPIDTADDRLLSILTNSCGDVIKKYSSTPSNLVSRIHKVAIEMLPRAKANADVIASELGMSTRSMHRHLAHEGSAYSEILEDLKKDLAIEYLAEKDLRMSEVAFLLGYSEQSSFSTAFKRWTGKTPREVRQA